MVRDNKMKINVIRNLRIRIVFATVLTQCILFAVLLFVMNHTLHLQELEKSYEFLEMIADNNGKDPNSLQKDIILDSDSFENYPSIDDFMLIPYRMLLKGKNVWTCFSVTVDKSGNIQNFIRNFMTDTSNVEINSIVKEILEECGDKLNEYDDIKGFISDFYYFVRIKPDFSRLICVMDRRDEFETFEILFKVSKIIFIICTIATLIFSILITRLIVLPIKNAFEKQKRFVADAGHELKTPIAVIGANLDILLSDYPENRWLSYIKDENERMGHLVQNLLYLARNDANRLEVQNASFNFSDAMKNSVLPFESVAFESNKKLELNIDDDILFTGDEEKLKQVVIILVDNAIKNSEENALIKVSLYQEKDKIILRVFNTGNGIEKDDLEKIFLRFYRSDDSRARKTGGYGLGLSIAKSIAELHRGSLIAKSEVGKWAEFILTLPSHSSKLKFFDKFLTKKLSK